MCGFLKKLFTPPPYDGPSGPPTLLGSVAKLGKAFLGLEDPEKLPYVIVETGAA